MADAGVLVKLREEFDRLTVAKDVHRISSGESWRINRWPTLPLRIALNWLLVNLGELKENDGTV